ncbi:unnamed protein product [Miscanthus lutarioriparius]|uniref:Uncharacterized protein n=1 Tax=Miscanthus lutarioriparius TaxID=422564 RepID=A0A811Q4H2_9POAL|nr:unnamed protein product [Miscanthus lutarioriparius]
MPIFVPIGEITTRLRSRGFRTDNERDQFDSDVAMDENNQINAATHNTEGPAKSERKLTINNQLRKRRAKGKHIDIKFPKEFAKVCGEHASLFKSEITVLVRTVPLQVKKWRDMDKFHPGTTTSIWRKLKQKFPELSEEDKDCAMRQVESQYNNWRIVYFKLTETSQGHNMSHQKKRSNQNSINRGKQEMGSKVGTRSIAQIAYDLTKLHEGARIHQEKISSTPVPIVEALRTSSWSKAKHSCGVGIHAVNRVVEERIKLQEQIEASEQREAAARARADAAEQRARALEGQVSMMVKTNAQLQEEQQFQCDELSSLREAQSGEVARLVREQLDHQMAELIARIGVKRVILRFECS